MMVQVFVQANEISFTSIIENSLTGGNTWNFTSAIASSRMIYVSCETPPLNFFKINFNSNRIDGDAKEGVNL